MGQFGEFAIDAGNSSHGGLVNDSELVAKVFASRRRVRKPSTFRISTRFVSNGLNSRLPLRYITLSKDTSALLITLYHLLWGTFSCRVGGEKM